MRVFGIIGPQDSGKTALLLALVAALKARGLTVSTITQAPPGFDLDKPGKDSYVHRTSGAREVVVASASRWAIMHEYRDQTPFSLDQLLNRLAPADVVLVEGFAGQGDHPRVALCPPGHVPAPAPHVVAMIAAQPVPDAAVPSLAPDDMDALVDLVLQRGT